MAEQFIEDIYTKSLLSFNYRRCLQYLNKGGISDFCNLWTENTGILMNIIKDWSQYNIQKASLLQEDAVLISKSMTDPMLMAKVLERDLLPLLYEYIKLVADIDVTEGSIQLKSSESGFLNIYDLDKKQHLHSIIDPMWEAYEKSCALYEGKVDKIVILGCGLGYLPFQFWKRSYESAEIVILDTNETIIEYARNYGVLDWISQDKLTVVCQNDTGKLLELYVNESSSNNTLSIISDWMIGEFEGELKESVQMSINRQRASIEFGPMYSVNYWRNRAKSEMTIKDLPIPNGYKSAAVIAAGPSLDKNIEYLKTTQDDKCIISVNTALRKLLRAGIKPDCVCIIDPTPDVQSHIEGIENEVEDIPLVAESVAYWGYVDLYHGPIYRALAVEFEPAKDEAKKKEVPVLQIGSNVSNLAIDLAVFFGYEEIELVGLDLAFPGNKHHAGDESTLSERALVGSINVEDVYGNTVMSVEAFNHFRSDVEKQIINYRDRRFVNISKEGARIHGTVSGYILDCILQNSMYGMLIGKLSAETRKMFFQLESWVCGTPIDRKKSLPEQMVFAFNNLEKASPEKESLTELLLCLLEASRRIGDKAAQVYLYSILYGITNEEDYIAKCISLFLASREYGLEEYHYMYRQMKYILSDKPISENIINSVNQLWIYTVEKCMEKLKEKGISKIKYEKQKSDYVFVFVNEIRDLLNYKTKKILDKCTNLMHRKKVLLINTAEGESLVGAFALYGANTQIPSEEYTDCDRITYKGVQIPYIHCGKDMPNIDTIILILSAIERQKPEELITIEDNNLILDLILGE